MMEPRTVGRPRSEAARRAVLDAAVRLVDSHGYGALTTEGIARHAGVSKETVYRWWPTKAAIVLEALVDGASSAVPTPDTGRLASDLEQFAQVTVAVATPRTVRLLAGLMAEAQFDEAFAPAFLEGFLARRRAVLREVLERARERGEIAGSVDLDGLTETFFGRLWYRILSRHAPLDRRFADCLAQTVLRLAAPRRAAAESGA